MNRRALVLDAARRALELRQKHGLSRDEAISAIDLAHKIGLQVWFRDAKSYDGVYSAGGPPIVVLSSLRPLGRTAMTCAHEIGHHVYSHASKIEEVLDGNTEENDSDELLAHAFAAHLLMPRIAVIRAFAVRQINASQLEALDVFRVSSVLGVGYTSLLRHMYHDLSMISRDVLERLERGQPQHAKEHLSGQEGGSHDVIFVDEHWTARPIDCRVDDYVCFPRAVTVEGGILELVRSVADATAYRVTKVGLGRVGDGAWSGPIRASRRGKTGRAIYIYDEEDDDA